jgi:hypothetical protein
MIFYKRRFICLFFMYLTSNIGVLTAQLLDESILYQISRSLEEEDRLLAYKPSLYNFQIQYDSETFVPVLIKPDSLSEKEMKILKKLGEAKIIEILMLGYNVFPIYPLSKRVNINSKGFVPDDLSIKVGRKKFFFRQDDLQNELLYIDTVGIVNSQVVVSVGYAQYSFNRNYYFDFSSEGPKLVAIKSQWNFFHY